MKGKKLGLIAGTLIVVGLGSVGLMASIIHMKGAIQEGLSKNTQMDSTVGTPIVETQKETESTSVNQFPDFALDFLPLDEKIQICSTSPKDADAAVTEILLDQMEEKLQACETDEEREEVKKEFADILTDTGEVITNLYLPNVSFVYCGQKVEMADGLLEKEEAQKTATDIMKYIYDCIDEALLVPCGIDKTQYEYSIQRQYHYDGARYSVRMIKDDDYICRMMMDVSDEIKLSFFYQSALVDAYEGSYDEVRENYELGVWCRTKEQRESIYNEYFEKSRALLEDVLGLPAILEDVRDTECRSYFNAGQRVYSVTLGYVLEDGQYVQVTYNRISGVWTKIEFAGYHEDYYTAK